MKRMMDNARQRLRNTKISADTGGGGGVSRKGACNVKLGAEMRRG